MKITCLPALTCMLLLSLFGCKKGVEQSTGTTTPVTNPVVQQGNYSGQFLTLSTTEKLAGLKIYLRVTRTKWYHFTSPKITWLYLQKMQMVRESRPVM